MNHKSKDPPDMNLFQQSKTAYELAEDGDSHTTAFNDTH